MAAREISAAPNQKEKILSCLVKCFKCIGFTLGLAAVQILSINSTQAHRAASLLSRADGKKSTTSGRGFAGGRIFQTLVAVPAHTRVQMRACPLYMHAVVHPGFFRYRVVSSDRTILCVSRGTHKLASQHFNSFQVLWHHV